MVMGLPGKVKRQLTEDERQRFRENAKHYVEAARIYKDETAG
jgi:carbonic anhydrase/acetyltransferase-like protein (isoleucine patch superfamily)